MSGGSISLSEKLLVAGAFVALVAMAVGTEDDPGVVSASGTALAGKAIAVKVAGAAANPWAKPDSASGPDTIGSATGPDHPITVSPGAPPPRIPEEDPLPAGFGSRPSLPPE